MQNTVIENLSAHIPESIVNDLLQTHSEVTGSYRSGDLQNVLTKAGRFVEHTLRALEYLCSNKVVNRIKSVSEAINDLEQQTVLPESLRLIVPRVCNAIYCVRSKRNAVHVNEIDPTQIDAAYVVATLNWVLAELVRIYHVSDEKLVKGTMDALSKSTLPLIEEIDGEHFVGKWVPAEVELLLLLTSAGSTGMTRRDLGKSAKCSPPSVTKGLKRLVQNRYVHLTNANLYVLTSHGQLYLAERLEHEG